MDIMALGSIKFKTLISLSVGRAILSGRMLYVVMTEFPVFNVGSTSLVVTR